MPSSATRGALHRRLSVFVEWIATETGDDHGKARRFDRVERDRRVRRSSDGEARSSQRTSAFAVAV
jgi:hypothetical protein